VWTESLQEIYGYGPEEFPGTIQAFTERLHPEDRESALELVNRAVDERSELDFEARIILPSGEVRWLQSRGQLVFRADGAPERMVGVSMDITERKHAEEAARTAIEQSIAMKDQFLALVSHELRTPITTILGNALILLRRNDKLQEDTRRQALSDVANEAERLQRIIENLLLLTRIDVDEHVDAEPLRLQPLIAQTVETLRLRNPRRNVEVSHDEELPIVQGQSELLALVIENLITNADKYSPPESNIEVLVQANGRDDVEVCVRDYGIGLDESDIEQVFTPFYRSARAKSQAKGIGLGLAVCKRVMEAQGGLLRAVARPDGGSDFIFNVKRYREDDE
jgi:PAS domain S-box-containing protein